MVSKKQAVGMIVGGMVLAGGLVAALYDYNDTSGNEMRQKQQYCMYVKGDIAWQWETNESNNMFFDSCKSEVAQGLWHHVTNNAEATTEACIRDWYGSSWSAAATLSPKTQAIEDCKDVKVWDGDYILSTEDLHEMLERTKKLAEKIAAEENLDAKKLTNQMLALRQAGIDGEQAFVEIKREGDDASVERFTRALMGLQQIPGVTIKTVREMAREGIWW